MIDTQRVSTSPLPASSSDRAADGENRGEARGGSSNFSLCTLFKDNIEGVSNSRRVGLVSDKRDK